MTLTQANASRASKLRLLLARCFAILALVITIFALPARSVQASPQWFGINLPWFAYGHSFGADGLYGYSAVYNSSQAQSDLNDMKSKHLNMVRVWLFEDFQGLSFDSNWNCTGVSQQFLTNLLDFVQRANGDGINVYCMFFNNNDIANHPYVIEGGMTPLINNAILPVVNMLKPYGVCYDLINESDYAANSLGWSTVRSFANWATNQIHGTGTGASVTMSTDNASDFSSSNFWNTVGGLGFDFYDCHCYSTSSSPIQATPSQVQDGKPLFMGEYGPSSGWSNYSASQQQGFVNNFCSDANSLGYSGMLAWCYLPDGENYQLQGANTLWNIEYYGDEWGVN